MIHHLILFITIFLLTSLASGQNYQTDFNEALKKGDTTKQRELLNKWENEEPNNPELYTSYFNYYFLLSRQEVLAISNDAPEGESFSLKDSTGKTAGYLGGQTYYNPEIINKGFEKIDAGIQLYPDRLDMRFGKIYILGVIKNWDQFTDEIITTITYSSTNDNNWTWTNNERRDDGEHFFLSSLQDYQLKLYNTGDDSLLINMRKIAKEILKYYPDHIESLSNISITYLLLDEYDKGIEALLKAEKIDPTDAIVLSNIAQGYKLKGDAEMAIRYYEKVIEHGDEDISSFAQQQIEELKK